LQAMQIQIHQRETTRTRNKFLSEVGVRLEFLREFAGESAAFGLLDQPLVRRNKKTTCATGWIADCEIFRYAGSRLRTPNDGLNENARCEVLARDLFAFASRLFHQPFECSCFDIDAESRPLGLINNTEQLLQIDRIVESRLSAREYVAKQTTLLTELS